MSCDPTQSIDDQIDECATFTISGRILDAIRDRGEDICLTEDEILVAQAAFRNNWRCGVVAVDVVFDDSTNTMDINYTGACEQTLRATRLNVYPDEIELVWFDDKDVDNPVYGLWLALQDSAFLAAIQAQVDQGNIDAEDVPSIDDLCTPRDGSIHVRNFAYDNPPEQAKYW
jgi:hypothetical protein